MSIAPMDKLSDIALTKMLAMAVEVKNKIVQADKALMASVSIQNDLTFSTASTYDKHYSGQVDVRLNVEDDQGRTMSVRYLWSQPSVRDIKTETNPCSLMVPSVLTRFKAFLDSFNITAGGLPGTVVTDNHGPAPAAKTDYKFEYYETDPNASIAKGDTLELVITPEYTEPVRWQTTNTRIATVSDSGVVTGVGNGSVVITAGPLVNAVHEYITICVAVS